MAERRQFPPPWDIEEANAACFIVKDNNGQALAYMYFEQEPGRRTAADLLTRDEARRIAANIAKLGVCGGRSRLNVRARKTLPLLIQLRTNRFTGNIDVMGHKRKLGPLFYNPKCL